MNEIWENHDVPIRLMAPENVKNWKFCDASYYEHAINQRHVNQQSEKVYEFWKHNVILQIFP